MLMMMIRGRRRWVRRSVRPLGHFNDELGHWLRITIKVWSHINRDVNAKRSCTPGVSVFHGYIKHEMGRAVPAFAVKESLLRQHIRHRARLEGRQFPFRNRGLHSLFHFSFRFSSQCQFCPDHKDRYQRLGSLRVVANRTMPLRVPKLGTVFELVHPAVYVSDKAVRALDGSFKAMPSKDQNGGVLANGWGSRASSHSNLRVAIHQILLERGHAGDTDSWCPVRALVAPHLTQRLEQKMPTRSSSLSFVSLVFLFDTILNTPSVHFSLRRSYITGASVPSDHLLTGTRKTENDSGALAVPPKIGELGRFAPQVLASFAGA